MPERALETVVPELAEERTEVPDELPEEDRLEEPADDRVELLELADDRTEELPEEDRTVEVPEDRVELLADDRTEELPEEDRTAELPAVLLEEWLELELAEDRLLALPVLWLERVLEPVLWLDRVEDPVLPEERVVWAAISPVATRESPRTRAAAMRMIFFIVNQF